MGLRVVDVVAVSWRRPGRIPVVQQPGLNVRGLLMLLSRLETLHLLSKMNCETGISDRRVGVVRCWKLSW